MGGAMNINFELYKTFYVVAKHKNITKASHELLISQPAVSKAIKNLETQLGCTLFIRNKSGVILTEAGALLLKDIENVVQILQNSEEKIKNLTSLDHVVLTIGTSKTIVEKYLSPYIQTFYNRYPNIKIGIVTGSDKDLIQKARTGLIDMIIANTPYDVPDDFAITKLKKIHTIFVGSPHYKDIVIKEDNIEKLPLILQSEGSTTRYYFNKIMNNYNFHITPKMEFTSSTLALQFIKIGVGIGIATKEYLNHELEDKTLYELKSTISLDNRYISVITCCNQTMSNATIAFIKILEKK